MRIASELEAPSANLQTKSGRRWKVGIFTELYPPSIGGQEIRFAEIGAALFQRGHSVNIYCIAHQSGLPAMETVGGVTIHRHPVDAAYTAPRPAALKRRPLTVLRYAWWARQVAKREKFDLCLYNQWPFAHILFAPQVARQRAILDWCETRAAAVYRWAQASLPRLAAANMAVSPAVCAEIKAQSGRDTFYLPSGIHVAHYRNVPVAERSGILYLGRIAPHKNLPLLVEAFELLRKEGFPGRLSIAGGGPALEDVRALAARSPESAMIDILGPVSEEQKVDLLSRSMLLAMPSKREGFPRVVAEAMASGTPTVTADFPDNGTKAVVDYYGCGVVAPQGSAPAFAQAIRDTLENRQNFANVGLRRAQELDWATLLDLLENQAPV